MGNKHPKNFVPANANKNQLDTSQPEMEQFKCAVCAELMVNPTTINCGHSFCRHCLAGWFNTSNKTECPLCRQVYAGHPQVNIILRSTIEDRFPTDMKSRKEAVDSDPETKTSIDKFDSQLRNPTRVRPNKPANGFYGGVIFTIFALAILWLLWCVVKWLFASSSVTSLPAKNSLAMWSPDEIVNWVRDLGPWTHDHLLPYFESKQISGYVLAEMTYEDLASAVPDVQPLFIRAFLKAVDEYGGHRPLPPSDLWSFKDRYLFFSMMVLVMYQDLPRFTLLFFYLWQYHSTLLPFLHVIYNVYDANSVNVEQTDNASPQMSTQLAASNWADFCVEWLLCPYVLLIRFMLNSTMLSSNWFTSYLYMVYCAFKTCREVVYFNKVFHLTSRQRGMLLTKNYLVSLWKHIVAFAVCCVIWSVMPTFICNLIFFIQLYTLPFVHMFNQSAGQI